MHNKKVFISLGSNMGDRLTNIMMGLALLNKIPTTKVIKVSSIYETEPVEYKEQGSFLNAMAQVTTTLTPQKLLSALQIIEAKMHRQRLVPKGPRTLDLDIIFVGDMIVDTVNLTIPHKRAHTRKFVLAPLAEIAPNFVHPTLGTTTKHMLEELHNPEYVVIYKSLAHHTEIPATTAADDKKELLAR